MEEVAILLQNTLAEGVEAAREVAVARAVERHADERAIPRPDVRIRVRRVLRNIGVVRRGNRAALVRLRADREEGALVDALEGFRQVAEVRLVLVYPGAPEIARALQECFG